MKIPKSTKLFGLTITTVFDDTLCKRKEFVGEADYRGQRIVLDKTVCTRETLEQSYLHELIHWILFMMNKQELRNDEDFVDTFAHLLYQANIMQSAEIVYEEQSINDGDKVTDDCKINPIQTTTKCQLAKETNETDKLLDDKINTIGMKVRHDKFGVGTIRKVEGSGEGKKVVIWFESVGPKKLMLRFTELEYLSGHVYDDVQHPETIKEVSACTKSSANRNELIAKPIMYYTFIRRNNCNEFHASTEKEKVNIGDAFIESKCFDDPEYDEWNSTVYLRHQHELYQYILCGSGLSEAIDWKATPKNILRKKPLISPNSNKEDENDCDADQQSENICVAQNDEHIFHSGYDDYVSSDDPVGNDDVDEDYETTEMNLIMNEVGEDNDSFARSNEDGWFYEDEN